MYKPIDSKGTSKHQGGGSPYILSSEIKLKRFRHPPLIIPRQQMDYERELSPAEIKEIGLKKQINRQVGYREREEDKNAILTEMLLESWKNNTDFDTVESLAWDYVGKFPTWQKHNSEIFDLKTVIKEVENKKGEKVLYHYTHNNGFVGTVKKLGTEPVFYDGWFRITFEAFEFNKFKLRSAEKIADLFEPEDKSENVTLASLA